MIEILALDTVICGVCGQEDEGLEFSEALTRDDGGACITVSFQVCEACISNAFKRFEKDN